MSKIILDLCGGTGSWAKPYKDNGYDVRTLTLPDFDVTKWQDNEEFVQLLQSNTIHGILAAPPCTMFSIARNDKTARNPRDMRGGMEIVKACLDIVHECLYEPFRISENSLKFWALENPHGYLYRYLGRPPFEFDPCEFGDQYKKRTQIWGMFNEPKKASICDTLDMKGLDFVKNVENFRHLKEGMIPTGYKEKTKLSWRTITRSITPQGFARAFFKANP